MPLHRAHAQGGEDRPAEGCRLRRKGCLPYPHPGEPPRSPGSCPNPVPQTQWKRNLTLRTEPRTPRPLVTVSACPSRGKTGDTDTALVLFNHRKTLPVKL